MAEIKNYKVVFQFRRATTEEWSLNEDEIPYAGEPCYDLNLGTLRIGDGNTPYRDLKVIGSASISDDGLSLVLDNVQKDIVGLQEDNVKIQENIIETQEGISDAQEDIAELQALVGESSVERQIADAISDIRYDINESELQAMLDSVLDN